MSKVNILCINPSSPPLSSQVADRSLLSSLSLVYLCSNLSLIVAKVDGRGTGFRGDKYEPYSSVTVFKEKIRLNLETVTKNINLNWLLVYDFSLALSVVVYTTSFTLFLGYFMYDGGSLAP